MKRFHTKQKTQHMSAGHDLPYKEVNNHEGRANHGHKEMDSF